MLPTTRHIGKQKLAFTLDDYQQLVVINKTHHIRRRDNNFARIICTDFLQMRSIVYAWQRRIEYSVPIEYTATVKPNGHYFPTDNPSESDIFIVPND